MRLYARLSEGESIESAPAWIFTVARNSALDARRRGRRFEPLADAMRQALPDHAPNPEQEVLDQERRRRMREAVQGLSPQQQQCLHLRAEGLRYREIAQVLGIRGSTVGEFLQRGIGRLREVLK